MGGGEGVNRSVGSYTRGVQTSVGQHPNVAVWRSVEWRRDLATLWARNT